MSPLHRVRVHDAVLLAGALALLPSIVRASHDDLPTIAPNDNRTPAGRVEGGVLTVRLEARDGAWEPDGPDGPRLHVAAFAEPGGPLQTPGPLVRVAVGTTVRALVRNSLAVPLYL